MAVTYNINRAQPLLGSKISIVTGSVLIDSAYTAGGESLTPAQCGLASFDLVLLSIDANDGGVVAGLLLKANFDYTSNDIRVVVDDGTTGVPAEAATTGAQDVTVRFIAFGPPATA